MGSNLDFSTFKSNVETITELHFSSAIGRVALHLVPCRDICKDALQLLSQVSPQACAKIPEIGGWEWWRTFTNMGCVFDDLLPTILSCFFVNRQLR